MNKQFVPYQLSELLKEIGFDEPCLGFYTLFSKELITRTRVTRTNSELVNITAPLWQQAFDWFRERGIFSIIEPVYCEDAIQKIKFDFEIYMLDCEEEEFNNLPYHTYEEAQEALLKQLIKDYKKHGSS